MHVKRNDSNTKNRMKGDFHVRFRERLRVKFPWSTRQRTIRPLTNNRKNSLFYGSERGVEMPFGSTHGWDRQGSWLELEELDGQSRS